MNQFEEIEQQAAEMLQEDVLIRRGLEADEFCRSPLGRHIRQFMVDDYLAFVKADLEHLDGMPSDALDAAREQARISRQAYGWLLGAINDGRVAMQNKALSE